MKYFIFSLFILVSSFSKGQFIVTERPGQSESSIVVPKRSFQIESGVLYSQVEEDQTLKSAQIPVTLFRYGLSEMLELRIQNEYLTISDSSESLSGFGNVQFGLKAGLVDLKGHQLSYLIQHAFRNPYGAVANPEAVTFTKLIYTYNINSLGFSSNVGLFFNEDKSKDLLVTLKLNETVSDRFSFFVEGYNQSRGIGTDEAEYLWSLNAGMAYLLGNRIQLDYAFGYGLSDHSAYMGAGISIRFDKG